MVPDQKVVSDSWLVGVVANDDALAGVRVHAGLLAAGPASGRPERVHVRMRFSVETESGFPDAVESAALLVVEESVVAALDEIAVFVAVVTAPGFRDLVFHTADVAACREGLAAREAGSGDDALEVDADPDPGWSHYRALFTDAVPADADRRLIADLVRERSEEAPTFRLVHHFSFPSLHEADQAAAALRTSGVEVSFVVPDDVDAEAPPAIEVRDSETVTQADMARSRDALSAFALSWDGTYEGWSVDDR